MKQAYVGGKIYPIVDPPIENGTMIVENGIVIDIGPNVSTDGAEIINCEGLHITPGFIDAHTHTGVWGEGVSQNIDNDGNEITEAITPYVRALDSIHPEDYGFEDARKGGVTTLGITHGSANPIGGQFCIVKSYGKEVDEMIIKQPAGLKMALGENPKRVGTIYKRAPTTRMGTAYLIRQAFYEAIDYQMEWEHYLELVQLEEIKPENERKPVKKPKYDLGKEVLVKVLSGEMPVRCHGHRADDIRTAIRLSEEFGYELVLDHATESYKIKEVVARKQIPIVVGPSFGGRTKRELIDQSMATPGIMMKEGVNVSIMTDSPFIPIHGLRDLVIMAIREGLPEERALETITVNPAKLLGVDERVGSLVKGKDADFLIFNGDPLDARKQVIKTYIDGNLVFEHK
ncbi:MAG: amidohydrolase [Candidatus Kariarchaeaceae archaeon]|jgi:imidazolonepropionase-like amidohydrolase